ncbi:Crp/Fnr family transcriptional regulator [Ulvibacter litoralis]|uniref:cAMP-binding domain of CRP or a regulatory subunit of cAMP-dependent protein kinases n=1 Tax=Ulvibacter litoralis TaxID=227084 RepID=A0A1G7EVI8_9FLAO|nr:Crp/Fnr family transcriptional regulator [Ulvibacter litoralis]GHC53777.1 Crp/Fnr family transcriptional regulator [Ulvibacter litoralis]SDE67612.1 cAMP-binding domain of CRP or a regulatory subunit of cAMP-dependent protein kinases [Ulvibacter litoralis]
MKSFYSRFDFQSNLLFEALTTAEKKTVYNAMESLSIKKGSLLFYEEGIPTGIFQIKKGKAKKIKKGFSGSEQIFYIYTTGDVLGYHALFGEERYQDSCEALEDLEVNFIAKDVFFQLLKSIPRLQQTFIKNIGHEFGVLANIIAVLAQKNLNARLAINLLILNNRFQKQYKAGSGIDLTREDLANVIGTSPESLGRCLKYFKDQGSIEVDKRVIYIKNEESLFQLLNSSS